MVQIKLANNKGHFIVDNNDFGKLKKYNWHLLPGNNNNYAATKIGGKTVYAHRFIMHPPKEKEIDHINGNGLDDRRCNLRLVTRSQNRMNIHHCCSKSKFKGVRFLSNSARGIRKKPWNAKITLTGKTISLGVFYTAEEAAKAYDMKAKELFSEFACTNFED